MSGCFLCPSDFALAPSEGLLDHLETCHKVQRGQELMAALHSVGDQGRQMVQCHLQAWLDIKVEPIETLEEVKKEEQLEDVNKENLNMGLAEQEERDRRMALDYYVDMATNNGGALKISSESKRKRKSETEKRDGETRERKPRKPRNARAPRKPRDRLG